jgi:outer membrane protein assembly factor BamB
MAADGTFAFAGTVPQPALVETTMLARWSADGALIWQKTLGDICASNYRCPATVHGVAVDSGGAILVAGAVEPWLNIGHLDLGQGPVNPHGESGFVAKFAPDGQVLWSRGIAFSESYGIAAAGDTVAIIGEARCGATERAPFVMALDDATGTERWARWMPPGPVGTRLSTGRVTVATDGVVAFTLSGGDEPRVIVGSVDPSGSVAWSRVIYPGTSGLEPPPAIVAVPSGLVLLPSRDRPGREVGRVIGLVR